jgi:iron complex outermembrane receptor protein
MWLDLDWNFTKYLNITGGVRADVLFFNVTDWQENVSPDDVVPYRRTAAGVAVGPRAVATVKPIEQLDVVLSYGRGFRSPQARTIIENDNVDFTRVHSADIGLRSRIGKNDELKLALTGFFTKLSNDLIFEAHEARFEPIGPTTRVGAVFYAQARPLPWLYGAFSVTYAKASLDETPAAEPGEPDPGLAAGDPIPFVPPWLLRLDVGASEDLVELGKHPLNGRIGLGYTFLGERPLRFSQTSPRVNLLELNAGLSWWFLELGFQAFNLLNVQYAAQEFVFESNWDPTTPPPDQPARHIAAGAPRTFLFQIGFRL